MLFKLYALNTKTCLQAVLTAWQISGLYYSLNACAKAHKVPFFTVRCKDQKLASLPNLSKKYTPL